MSFTIITVNFNNEIGLEKTILNVDILNKFLNLNVNNLVCFVYGNKVEDGKSYTAQDISVLKYGVIHACHQSMFFRRSLKIKYDKDCKIYGDYGYVVDHELVRINSSLYFNEIISQTEPGGVGAQKTFRKRYEKYWLVLKKLGLFYLLLSLLYRVKLKLKKILGL